MPFCLIPAILRLAGPGAIKNHATQERAQRLDRVGIQQLPRHPAGTEGSTPPGPAEALRRARTRCAPVMREQGLVAAQPRRKDPAPPPPAADLGSRPDLVQRDSRQQARDEVGRRYHLYPHLGGVRVPGDRPRLLHEESSRVRDWGDNMRTDLICEAIDMAVRRCPYTTGETILLPRAGTASTPPSSSPGTWKATALALRRAGPGCAGRVPGRKSAGATLKNERVYQMVYPARSKAIRDTAPSGRARYTRSETTPLCPGVQDAQRGRGGAPNNKTSSLKDRFQSCPRHAQQPRVR